VLIHISINGWIHGHSHHQDGRDILLGDKPGPCPTGKTSATTTVATTTTTNAATTTTTVATTTTTAAAAATTTTVAAAAASSSTPTPPPSPASGVKGASKTIVAPASHRPSHGVLGVAKTLGSSATSGTLPFTGLRLWIVELVALGLIGGGVAMRLIARRRFNS
jgi:cobalamin biosynthesis Mg chelatase CobN